MRNMTLHFYVRNAKILSSDQLQTFDNFSLSYIRGGLGVIGCILDLPEGSERNHMLPLVKFLRAHRVSELWAPPSGILYKLYVVEETRGNV